MQRLPFHPNTAMPSTLPADVRAAFTPTGALRASITHGSCDGETDDRELPARQQASLY